MSDPKKYEGADSEIAIVGLSGRFPGARNVDEFWRNVRDGVESIVEYSHEELLEAGVDSELLADPSYVKAGFPLDGIDLFDAPFFGFSPKDAAIMDPQHRLFMECAWEALENCGHTPERFKGSIGVFAGCGMNAYFVFNILTNPDLLKSVGFFLLRHTGNDRDFLPTTASYKLNLTGPSVAIQTACSTSLVAIHAACQSLLSGECDMALAGGVTLQIPHRQGYLYRENEAMSPDGHCRAFDRNAGGTVVGSGVGIVVLRRLADAIEDGDFIHALIKGSAINNDGATKVGYLAPSVEGQARVIAEALAVAGTNPESISYLEAHGTGTPIGDPIEISALTQAYREGTDTKGFCPIGSTKPNIGHLDTAAGVASLIKVVEALKHRQIPPSICFEAPNPNIDFENSPCYVNAKLSEWKSANGPRRAGISSLGIGGTNAHVIVQEAPTREPSTPSRRQYQILAHSAKTPSALESATLRLADHLKQNSSVELPDIAYTLQTGRKPFEQRRIAVCRDADEAVQVLDARDPKRVFSGQAQGSAPSVVFLFPGGGAQYVNMGRGLYETELVYREAMGECCEFFRKHGDVNVKALVYPSEDKAEQAARRIHTPSGLTAAVFSTEYALAKLWMSWGIQPGAMTGHSLGEYTAATLAGVLSLENAIRVVALRGRLIEKIQGEDGAMLSVPLPEDEVRELLGDKLDLGSVNGPSLCVVSGRTQRIEALEAELAERDVEARRLRVIAAGHCRLMDPMLDEFHGGIAAIDFAPPRIPYVSNVTGTWVRPEDAQDPNYWVRHMRETVRFSDGLGTLLRDSNRVLLEVGPGQTLSSLVRQQSTKPKAVLASLRHPKEEAPDSRYLLQTLGRLWIAGVDVDWPRIHAGERRSRVPLPTYPFERESYWIKPGEAVRPSESRSKAIVKQPDLESWFYRPVWKRSEGTPGGRATLQGTEKLTWLLFVDGAGLGNAISERLRAAGHDVVTVQERDVYCRLGDDSYALAPESGREGYDALVRDLAEREQLPDRIVHLWTVTVDEKARPGSSFFHRNQERGFYSLFYLAQAFSGEDLQQPVHLAVVSNGMQAINSERLPYPEKATLLGPVKVIPHEMPEITCQSIDVDVPWLPRGRRGRKALRAAVEAGAERLAVELMEPQQEPVIAYRAGDRWVEDFEPIPSQELPVQTPHLRDGGVYLVSGGLGGIGFEVAEWLARSCRAKLVLFGRTGLPERHQWDRWLETHAERDPTTRKIRKIQELEALGAEVMAASADVANIEQMSELVSEARERFGGIHGLVHVAGTIDDDPIALKTPVSVESVFTPKVHGTRVLDTLLRDLDLDFFVLFSSMSSILGPAGQVDYVAANAFLNAFAKSKAGGKTYTIAIDWGVWKNVGMGIELSQQIRGEESLEGLVHELAEHPLLGERIQRDVDRVVYAVEYRPSQQWILDEHRTHSGRALVPGTGYLEIARAAVSAISPGDALELRDFSLISPLAVPDDAPSNVRITLERERDGWSVEFHSRPRAEGRTPWELHAQGHVARDASDPPEPCPIREIEARCNLRIDEAGGAALETKQERSLRFGPRWKCLRRAAFGRNEAVARLELDPDFASELSTYALHPALLDMATGYALPLIEGYEEANAVYVPLAYGRVQLRAPLTPRVLSYVRSRPGNSIDADTAEFDVLITDEEGRILVEVEEFTLRKLEDADALGAPRADASPGATAESLGGAYQLSSSERLFLQTYEAGVEANEGMEVLTRVLSTSLPPQVVVSSIDLHTWIARTNAIAQEAAESGAKFTRPKLASDYEAPRDELERTLAGYWEELLGVEDVGIHDDFFELGGHSLIAVRLFARVKKTYGVEHPISVLFQATTIAQLADLLGEQVAEAAGASAAQQTGSEPQYRYLVPMTPGDGGKPAFFLVAGMFGNVLNLRHLAVHLGQDQPMFAIQARGIYGDDEPHCRFEDMARDYLQEIRSVQPEGPYYLGGFSGGGVTAFEMAQQLLEQGEEVGMLLMLDSMPPFDHHQTIRDRIEMKLHDLRREGLGFFPRWARSRFEWELVHLRKRFVEPRELTPGEFRSEQIEIAFREALANYRPKVYPGKLILFRPPPERRWVLSGGRILNSDRYLADHHNHWKPYVAGGIDVHVVSGDHDAMVLEPHVRVLAAKFRACLEDAQRIKSEEDQL